MDEGPARRTRSATVQDKCEGATAILPVEITSDINESDSELFKTPSNTPTRKRKINKVRTPSGNFVTTPVEDIRNFFSQEDCAEKSPLRPRCATGKIVGQLSQTVVKTNAELRRKKELVDREESVTSASDTEIDNRRENPNWSKTNTTQRHGEEQFTRLCQQFRSPSRTARELREQSTQLKRTPTVKMSEYDKMCEVLEQRKKETIYRANREKKTKKARQASEEAFGANSEETLENEFCKELRKLGIVNGEDRMKELEKRQDELIDTLLNVKVELLESKATNNMLSGMLSHLSQIVSDVEGRVDKIELNNMRKSIVLFGLETTLNKNDCRKELVSFFKEEMSCEPNISDFFFLRRDTTSPMVIMFENLQEKSKVFNNLGRIKGLVNERDKPFFISHYLPPKMHEQKRREDEIFRENMQQDENDKINMERRSGKLYIESQPYGKKVKVPTIKEILALPAAEFNQSMEVNIVEGTPVKVEGNTFTGYAIDVNSFRDIEQAYIKLKVMKASARHIISAYRIPGIRTFETEDYTDDQDYACGKALLDWMKQSDIRCKAFFVARETSVKLGAQRFDNYIQAATNALMKAPINSINNIDQSSKVVSPTTALNTKVFRRKTGEKESRRRPTSRLSQSQKRGNASRRPSTRGGYNQGSFGKRKEVQIPPRLDPNEWPHVNPSNNERYVRNRQRDYDLKDT